MGISLVGFHVPRDSKLLEDPIQVVFHTTDNLVDSIPGHREWCRSLGYHPPSRTPLRVCSNPIPVVSKVEHNPLSKNPLKINRLATQQIKNSLPIVLYFEQSWPSPQ